MTTTARTCGSCTLCCKLLPTKEIEKPANVRCPHQRVGKGCSIYANRPMSCRLWSCQWLLGEELGERPDRSRLVVDPLPDFVVTVDDDTGERKEVPVVQVWCSSSDREAHRNPAFRAWLDRKGIPALIRFDNRSGLLIAPPSRSTDGEWFEKLSHYTEAEHTVEQKVAAGLSFNQPVVAMMRRLP
jgi:hypothetical protein